MEAVLGIFGKCCGLLEGITGSIWFQTPSMFGLSVKTLTLVYIIVFAAVDWLLLRISYYGKAYRTFAGPTAQLTFVVEAAILFVCIAAVVGVYGKKERVLLAFEWTLSGCVLVTPILYIVYCVRIARGTADGVEDLDVSEMLVLYTLLFIILSVFEYTCLHAIRIVDKLRREMSAGDGRRLMTNEPEFV